MPLPRPAQTNLLGDPGVELDLVLDQYADEIEATRVALAGKLDATDAALGAAINAAGAKATPVDNDNLLLADSAAGNTAKQLTWANLKTAITTALNGVFARLAGLAGGQTLTGGTAASESLTLRSTSHATKGKLLVGTSAYDEATNRLGIGVAAPTAALHLKAGTATASTAPLKLTDGTLLTTPEVGAVEQLAGRLYHTNADGVRLAIATESFVNVKAANLLPNGAGELLNNRNFSAYTFDAVDAYAAHGSFRVNVNTDAYRTDDLVPVDTTKRLRVSLWAKSGDVGGANYNPANRQYFGIAFYDIDGLEIGSEFADKVAAATDTTLAAPLEPGHTTITLTDATGWYNGSSSSTRGFTWFSYANSKGYIYPDYTYSRNRLSNAWDVGGISGNVITLKTPWAGPSLAAGSAVRNSGSGAAYRYMSTASNVAVPNAWTKYEHHVSGVAISGSTTHRFGTAFVKFGHIVNYHGAADNNVRLSHVRFEYLSSANLEPQIGIGATYKDLVQTSLPANGLAVEGFVGVGTSAPSRRHHVMGSAPQVRIGVDASNYTDISSAGSNLTFSGALLWSPGASVTPSVNGQITLELTNNTTLTIRAKGSDGTVRSAAITLS